MLSLSSTYVHFLGLCASSFFSHSFTLCTYFEWYLACIKHCFASQSSSRAVHTNFAVEARTIKPIWNPNGKSKKVIRNPRTDKRIDIHKCFQHKISLERKEHKSQSIYLPFGLRICERVGVVRSCVSMRSGYGTIQTDLMLPLLWKSTKFRF